ncbi:hypothetical protein [Streptomyces sp. NPDC058623]|uniref:hypothetical protein n=1 Tax=Streptomyces sp. NPDC058623 TaxID=3346563 RepID=UPI003664ED25
MTTPHSEQGARIEALVRRADPDAVWAVGSAEPDPAAADGEDESPFDAGALTGVLAVWPVLGSLVTRGELTLHTPLGVYGGPAADGLPGATTAHHLLTHADAPAALAALTRLAEHLCGVPATEFAATRIWAPLGMTRTRLAGGTLHTTGADLGRFLRHLLSGADQPIARAWTAESLRIRTGELTPARGLLWHPAPAGVWAHHDPSGTGPALWISPRHGRWATLRTTQGPGRGSSLHAAFRGAVFGATPVD